MKYLGEILSVKRCANVTDLRVFKTPKIISKRCSRRKEMPMAIKKKESSYLPIVAQSWLWIICF